MLQWDSVASKPQPRCLFLFMLQFTKRGVISPSSVAALGAEKTEISRSTQPHPPAPRSSSFPSALTGLAARGSLHLSAPAVSVRPPTERRQRTDLQLLQGPEDAPSPAQPGPCSVPTRSCNTIACGCFTSPCFDEQ